MPLTDVKLEQLALNLLALGSMMGVSCYRKEEIVINTVCTIFPQPVHRAWNQPSSADFIELPACSSGIPRSAECTPQVFKSPLIALCEKVQRA